jgi:hypothetical protein
LTLLLVQLKLGLELGLELEQVRKIAGLLA